MLEWRLAPHICLRQALELVNRGFKDIEGVRSAIQNGDRSLDRNQLVGVEAYEDIQEEMNREEVEEIGRLVREAVQSIYPGAEVRIMGSYRRLKEYCGDVDIHICHKSYVKHNPEGGLSKIVDLLWNQGHLAYHLTFFSGITTGIEVTDYLKSSKHIPLSAWQMSKVVGYMSNKGQRGSSYMGIVRSPKVAGKLRRLDIKFYPWRERVFAALYFTGNGYFNRSMRLWSVRKFK